MTLLLVQLSLLMMTVVQLTSSQSTYNVIQLDGDDSSCANHEQVLNRLVTAISQLSVANSQLTTAVSKLQRDVTELKSGSRQKGATGKLMGYKLLMCTCLWCVTSNIVYQVILQLG